MFKYYFGIYINMAVVLLRKVSRVGNSLAIFLPTRYVGKKLTITVVLPNAQKEYVFTAVPTPFGTAARVSIPAPLSVSVGEPVLVKVLEGGDGCGR